MNNTLRNVFMGAVLVALLAPLVVVGGVSVNEKKELLFPPRGFSLGWYGDLLSQADWLNAMKNSLIIAVASAALAVSVAFPVAYFLWRYKVFYARILFGLGVAPFMLPPVITALGFLLFWVNIGMYGQMPATIVSHAIFFVTLPLVTISLGLQSIDRQIIEASTTLGADDRMVFRSVILPLVTISLGLESIDRQIIEAATTMGASDRTIFRTVVLPMVRPYLISGYAFAFVLSLNEYIVAYMVAGFTVETLPIKIFNSLRYGYTPVMAAVAVVFVLVAMVVFGLIAKFGNLPKLLGAWSGKED